MTEQWTRIAYLYGFGRGREDKSLLPAGPQEGDREYLNDALYRESTEEEWLAFEDGYRAGVNSELGEINHDRPFRFM